ncbi:hypothetical protein AB0K51_12375 [Kitasatospora sp. NPDC049285]|uniref:hypothetical protein n=1 Tax=Kitasatospora sp. NPDC049285 TaxID=3157096 RepID=UPI0034442EB6
MHLNLTLLGTAAGTVIAVGTIVGYVARRIGRTALWILALSQLPDAVSGLADQVESLSGTVDALGRTVASLQSPPPPAAAQLTLETP